MITENNIKLERLPFWRERNSPHNRECGSAAVVLITPSIQPEPQVLAALIRHTASRTCAGVMNAPVSSAKYPPVLLGVPSSCAFISPEAPSWTQLRRTGQVVCAGGGWRPWTNGAFIAVGSGCLRTDNGLILPFLKQIAVCSLACLGDQRAVDAGQRGFCGEDEGEIPQIRVARAGQSWRSPPWRCCVQVCFYSLTHLENRSNGCLDTWSRFGFCQKTFQLSSEK